MVASPFSNFHTWREVHRGRRGATPPTIAAAATRLFSLKKSPIGVPPPPRLLMLDIQQRTIREVSRAVEDSFMEPAAVAAAAPEPAAAPAQEDESESPSESPDGLYALYPVADEYVNMVTNPLLHKV